MMPGLCRRATAYPNLMVHRYFVGTLAEEGIGPLVDWHPDVLIVCFGDTPLVEETSKNPPPSPDRLHEFY